MLFFHCFQRDAFSRTSHIVNIFQKDDACYEYSCGQRRASEYRRGGNTAENMEDVNNSFFNFEYEGFISDAFR